MEKKINLKKIFIEINDLGKKISNGFYIIDHKNKMLLSAYVKDYDVTYNIVYVDLDEMYHPYLKYLGNCVNGTLLSQVLKGTGVEIRLLENDTMEIESEVKVSTGKEHRKWITGLGVDEVWRYKALSNFDKYIAKNKKLKKMYKNEDLIHSTYELDLESIPSYKEKFVLDLRKDLNVAVMRITNKILKNFNKDTERIILTTTNFINPDSGKNKKRLLYIDMYNPNSITHIVHGFVDRE